MKKEEILKAVNYDISKAKEIYNWLNEDIHPIPANEDAVIEIYDDGEGLKGVRVRALGEDFVIDLRDLDGARGFTHESATNRLRDLGMTTFNKKQATIIGIYLDEINDSLVAADGKPFAKDWYVTSELFVPRDSSPDCGADSVWFLKGTAGCLDHASLKVDFRCRPVFSV